MLYKTCLVCALVAVTICSIALIGITGVILVHLKVQPVCNNSTPTNQSTLTTTTGLTGDQNMTTCAEKVDELYDFFNIAEKNIRNIEDILNTTRESAQNLINIVSTLSNFEATSASSSGVVNDILVVVDKLLELQNGSVLFNSIRPVSCQDILHVHPGSPSGYYHVNSRNIYCNMGELCGSGGGWTRLAYLDMTDATQHCPPGFRLYQTGGVTACGRPEGGASAVSVTFPSNGISYSQVCGRVIGYQYRSTDAVSFINHGSHSDLNSYYVDGVSITRGSPRQHVWTLMAGLFDTFANYYSKIYYCPCAPGYPQNVQSFIGSHYFCESGNPNNTWSPVLYSSDPLWDGQGCGTQETACCSAPGLPWFHRDYGNTTTTDYLELRVCGDESASNEDVPVSYYEIYVK